MGCSYVYTSNVWISILASALILALAIYSYRNRQMPGALTFSIACMLGLLWSIGSIFEIAAVDIGLKVFWRKFQVLFQLPSATAITCFLLEYTWPKRWLTRRNLILLSIIPIFVMISILTDNLHHLFWEDFLIRNGELVVIDGQIMKYFLAYVYFNFFMNLFIFVWLFIHSPQNRWPVAIMIVGQVFMRVFYFIDIADRSFMNFHFTAAGIAFTSLMYAIVFYRFQILGPIPLARQAMTEQLPIGMIILDAQGKIRKLNTLAEKIVKMKDRAAKGIAITQVLPNYPLDLFDQADGVELSWNFKESNRDYRLSLSKLQDWRDSQVGQLLMLEDVTDQNAAQAKILEQQRVLSALQEREMISRELHDNLAQVFAFIETQGQAIHRLLKKDDLEMAEKHLMRLVEAAHNGDIDIRETIRGMRVTLSKKGLLETLEDYLLAFTKNSSIQTEIVNAEVLDTAEVSAMVEIQLLRILQEALTNIRKHANASQVHIKFDSIDTSICVTVQDDGQGFALDEGTFRSINHYGLIMMQERAAGIGGKIEMTSEPGQGTKVFICVPIKGKWLKDE